MQTNPKGGGGKLLTYHRNDLKNETAVKVHTCKKMLHGKLKAKNFEALWNKHNKFFDTTHADRGQAQHSFLSRENKIKVKAPKAPSLGGARGGFSSGDHSWMRSNHTTGEAGKIDTFSLLEYEDDLSAALRKKVEEKKMQDWDQTDVEVFLREIGLGGR